MLGLVEGWDWATLTNVLAMSGVSAFTVFAGFRRYQFQVVELTGGP